MEKEKIKYKGFIERMWKDPVLSKVISVGLIALLVTIYSLFQTVTKEISFYKSLLETLNFKIEFFKFLLFILFTTIVYLAYNKWKSKRKLKIGKFNNEQIVGNFTFRELYNALLTSELETPDELYRHNFKKETDLLLLFELYHKQLNIGVGWEGNEFLYYSLAPTLMSYGITEKAPSSKSDSLGVDIIHTSKVGVEFYSLLEKFRIYNDEVSKTETFKIENIKPKKE